MTTTSNAKSNAKTPATQPSAVQPPNLPRNWADIKVGSLVLVQQSVEDGWWEAIVISIQDANVTIRWRDYPGEPGVTRRRDQIALFYSGA